MILLLYFIALYLLYNLSSNAKQFCQWAFFLLFLFIGCRSLSSGADTYGYYEDFIMKRWGPRGDDEPGFSFYTRMVYTFFGSNATIYLLMMAFPYVFALYKMVDREMKNKEEILIGIHLLFLLSIFGFIIAGIRQTIAMAFVLFSYKFLFGTKKDYIYYFLFIALAYLFHNSGVIGILLLPLSFIRKISYLNLLIPLVAFLISLLGHNAVINYLVQFMGDNDRFAVYTNESYMRHQSYYLFFIQILLLLVCFISRKHTMKNNKVNMFFFNCAILGACFQALANNTAEMFRMSYYYSVFLVPLFPQALYSITKSSLYKILIIGFCIVVLVYVFILSSSNIIDYMLIFFE